MNRIKRFFRIFVYLVKLSAAYLIGFFWKLFRPRYRNLWIISERGDDARDNGYFFYRFVVRNHPEQPIVYVIKNTSADFSRVQSLGKLVNHQSFRHFLLFAVARVRISTHAWGGDIPFDSYYQKLGLHKFSKKKFVFLQHGITKDSQPGFVFPKFSPSLFICGAEPEYRFIKSDFLHPEGVVQYTGFARFDNLHQIETKNQILLMPTFRKWLQRATADEVALSEYVAEWNAVLRSKKLTDLLEQYGIDLVFYPHYEMQKYVNLFASGSSRVHVAALKDYDVQTLLIESKLLVTDFSSVFFDFAYMDKPVVYYQFDRERYIREHYDFTKGYFSYDDNGFGEVVFDEANLFETIEAYIKSDFQVPKQYSERANQFFVLRDTENCSRIYQRISELLK